VSLLKPYSTLLVGMALGYFFGNKLVKMLPIGGA
jgi:hypothetical protein